MSKKVLVTEPIVESAIEKLRENYTVDVGKRGQYNDEQRLAEVIPGYHALLPMLSQPITANVIESGQNLEIIANYAVGYNNIDLEAAKHSGIKVANTPDVLTDSTADCALALLLATARHICASQQYLRNGQFNGWEPLGFLGLELQGKTLGIVGMGRIGTAVARRGKAFGLNIRYHNRTRAEEEIERALDAAYVDNIRNLAKQSDILSLNCPLTEKTHHLVDREILEIMPNHALLINTARGPVVDEKALAEALHQGLIGGAGLDVFEEEPQVHPDLLNAPNCVITPHIGSATHDTRKAMGRLAANAIIGILENRPESEIPNLLQL